MIDEGMYLVDIDGTLADLTHRLHYIQKKPADWGKFFAACAEDAPIMDVIRTIRTLGRKHGIVMVTGRNDEVRSQTEEWLTKYMIPFDSLFMRRAGDYRQDNVVKSELLDNILAQDHRTILGVFEDRQQVVDMYRSRGLRVYQVAKGDF